MRISSAGQRRSARRRAAAAANLTRSEVLMEEQVADQWRDWVAYLQAHRTLLEAEGTNATTSGDPFEHAPADDPATSARATLQSLGHVRRTLFDAERELARQQLQRNHEQKGGASTAIGDPRELDREVVDLLLHEALGKLEDDEHRRGQGRVPVGDDKWYGVNVAALQAAPSPAAYELGGSVVEDRRRRLLFAALTTLVFGLVFGVWWLWPRAGTTVRRVSAVTVNGATMAPWSVRQVVVERASGKSTLPVTATTATNWPSSPRPDTAYLLAASRYPVQLCLPAAQLADLATVTLLGDGDAPARRYTIDDASSTQRDLVVVACGEGAADQRRYGTLAATQYPASQLLGKPVLLVDAPLTPTITVRQISVSGRGDDPTLPPSQVRVAVVAEAPPTIDWPTLNPTLRSTTGDAVLPSEVLADGPGHWTLRYLVAPFAAPLDVAWSVQPSQASQPLWWRTTLPVPRTRDAVVRAALTLISATLTQGTDTDTTQPVVAVRIANKSSAPLQLTQSDLAITVGDQPAPVPDVAELQRPLAPNEQRTLRIPIPSYGDGRPVIITVGHQRLRVQR